MFFCPHPETVSEAPWVCSFLGEGWIRTSVSGRLLPPCLSQPLVISRDMISFEKLHPLKVYPVPSFLIESHSEIVKRSWWNTWSPFSKSLPSQRETTFVMDKHPENIQTEKRCTKLHLAPLKLQEQPLHSCYKGKSLFSSRHLGKTPVLPVRRYSALDGIVYSLQTWDLLIPGHLLYCLVHSLWTQRPFIEDRRDKSSGICLDNVLACPLTHQLHRLHNRWN